MADTHEESERPEKGYDEGKSIKDEHAPVGRQGVGVSSSDSVVLPQVLKRYAVESEIKEHVRLDVSHRNVKMPLLSTICEHMALLNTSLVSLSLSRNALGPHGAALLGKALVTNRSLHVLELEDCALIGSVYRPQYDGVKALAKGFESVRSTLRNLTLASNDLHPEGCRIVLGALSFHKTLTSLDMSGNLLSLFNAKQGVLALSYTVRYANQLASLTINDNPLSIAAWTILHDALVNSTALTSVSALRCNIPTEHLLTLPPHASPSAIVRKKPSRLSLDQT